MVQSFTPGPIEWIAPDAAAYEEGRQAGLLEAAARHLEATRMVRGTVELLSAPGDVLGESIEPFLEAGNLCDAIAKLARVRRYKPTMGFEALVAEWCTKTLGGGVYHDRQERARRVLEEAAGLAQALGLSRDDVIALVDHVFAKPPGDPHQELAGVAITLFAAAGAMDTTVLFVAARELGRINRIPDIIREKQAIKARLGLARFPLGWTED